MVFLGFFPGFDKTSFSSEELFDGSGVPWNVICFSCFGLNKIRLLEGFMYFF